MKRILLTSLAVFIFYMADAAVLTVDNNLDSGAMYSSLSAAHAAAAAGDTLLIHPSGYSYGSITITKNLAFIGPGHNPEFSGGLPAQAAEFTLGTGSNGTIIEGMWLSRIQGGLWSVANDITIRNNRIEGHTLISGTYGDWSDADNWLIEGNVLIDANTCGGCPMINPQQSANQTDNWIIRNNIIQSSAVGTPNWIFSNLNETHTVAHNLIIYRQPSNMMADCSWALFENNIVWSTSSNLDVDAGCTDCQFNNNIFYNPNATLEEVDGQDNLVNIDPEFETIEDVNFAYDMDYSLAPGSPAMTAASDGGELGFYGADYNFRMEGFPVDHPRVTFTTPQYIVVPLDTPFTIEFGAKRSGL